MQTPLRCATSRMAPGSSVARWRVRAPRLVLPLLAALALGCAGALGPVRIAWADGNPTFHINRPAAGPVGANVFIKISGGAASTRLNLGYTTQALGCLTPLTSTPFTNVPSVTTDDNGNYSGSFVWPAETGTGNFYLCAQKGADITTALQSDNAYSVLSASAPSITLAHAVASVPTANPIPVGGTPVPTATPEPDGVYTVGDQVLITGANFLPGGATLTVWISGDQNGLGQKLPLPDGSTKFNADTAGNFQVTVTLPAYRTGQVYLHVTTTDGSDGAPPTLRADAPAISVSQAPTPTPSPTVTPSPTPTPSAPPGSGGGPDVGRILGIAGLGSFSVLLLLIGTILLASAGTMQRQE
jgi:hypothetical protein